jgi:type IV fimbrial biogenesis protein FimT
MNMPSTNINLTRPQALYSGVTLIELVICLAIVSILSFIIVPTFNSIFLNARSDAHLNQVSQFIRYTRSQALAQQARVTLCPSTTGLECEQDWQAGAMIFIDEDNDQIRSQNEPLLKFETPFIPEGYVSYNNPANKLVFSRQGFPLGSAGSFVYCPENGNEEYARALILNFQGRIRIGRDSNGDQIVETTGANNVVCS